MTPEVDEVERRVSNAVADLRKVIAPPPGFERRILGSVNEGGTRRETARLIPQMAVVGALLILGGFLAFSLSRVRAIHTATPPVTSSRPIPKPSFSPVHITGAPLEDRYGSSLAYDAATGEMILFGGFSTASPNGGLNDTWTWDGHSWEARQGSNAPEPRTNAVMVYDGATGDVILFGGMSFPPAGTAKSAVMAGQASAPVPVNDTWIWNGQTWNEMHHLTAPSERFGSLAAYDQHSHKVVLFGGSGPSGQGVPLGDTWTWDGSSWTEQHPTHSPSGWMARAMVYSNDLGRVLLLASTGCSSGPCQTWQTWSWDGKDWTLYATGNLSTETGYGVQVAYDEATHMIVLFGGQILGGRAPNTYFNETWVEAPASGWRRVYPPTSPPPADFSAGSIAYDNKAAKILFFGPGEGFWTWDGRTWSRITSSS